MSTIEKYTEAVTLSEEAHRGQVRKGTKAPYFSHPLAVSAMVLGYGGSYTQAIAGLLHDVLEDCGAEYAAAIAAIDAHALTIVKDASDCIKGEGPKSDWFTRKLTYLAHFPEKDPDSYLVIACDKLHNSGDTVKEAAAVGFAALTKFRAPPAMVVWYFVALACVLHRGALQGYLPENVVQDLTRNIDVMLELLMDCEKTPNEVKEVDSLVTMLMYGDPFVCRLPVDYFGDKTSN